MAGDTHDFEYYREKIGGGDSARVMHHFVNGGGGAYLSIGTALDFPKQPAGRRLGILSEDRPPSRQDGRRNAALEAAILVLDQVVQRLAVQRRSAVRVFSISTAHLSFRASWRFGSKDRRGALFSLYTVSTARCAGATSRSTATCSLLPQPPTTLSNLSYQWIKRETIANRRLQHRLQAA